MAGTATVALTAARSWLATWGSTPAERDASFACDGFLPDADETLYRAVDVAAPPSMAFRWLCQLKAGPYSYDWIDNFGRQSPRHLVPGVERLEVGQRVMVFELVAFEVDRHLTLLFRGALLGDVAVTYAVVPVSPDRCRLVVKLLLRYPDIPVIRAICRWTAAPLDLIMMRRQLLNLKMLAERQADRYSAPR
jgi:hypothetical protein